MTQPHKPKRPWLPAEIARMVHLREVEKLKWKQIDHMLDRPDGGCAMKYEALRRGKNPSGRPNESGGRIELSNQQETARRARKKNAENRMSLTAAVFGDPPPGFSALDRKRSGASR